MSINENYKYEKVVFIPVVRRFYIYIKKIYYILIKLFIRKNGNRTSRRVSSVNLSR